ncbi:RNA-directed DNA polymerase [Sphingomonas molluscorum]|uniref:RNA-directed DNA polymerase n=1 Tax=Sphingomonas molluscorum TaxID=418184 RepID=UPI00234BF243
MANPTGNYLRTFHFKQAERPGEIEHRELFVPGAGEALAEAALLAECASRWKGVASDRCYSYRPTEKEDRSGYFEPHMIGLRERQEKIASACSSLPNGVVAYIDIKKFYSSISTELAAERWLTFCNDVDMPERLVDLGFKLIENYGKRSADGKLITGPMFSHLLANLVLTPIDDISKSLPVTYVRYVDDITLIGEIEHVRLSIDKLRARLGSIGLEVHDFSSPKTMVVPCQQWLEGADDFSPGAHSTAWMKLIGDIKKVIILGISQASEVEDALFSEGFRLPVPDYATATREVTTFQKVRALGLWSWLRFKARNVNTDTILGDAKRLAESMISETRVLLNAGKKTSGFQRKRVVSKLRYRLGRLIYIGSEPELSTLMEGLDAWPELNYHSEIIRAIVTGNCSKVVSMGTNVAQATAQVFRSALKTANFSDPVVTEVEIQGLAVLILNGVAVEAGVRSKEHPLLRFAMGPVDLELMEQPRGLVQELACLHGLGDQRHTSTLNTAFDIADQVVLDALEMDYRYSF